MTRPHPAGETTPTVVSRVAERVRSAAPIAFLVVAPFAGSSGLRTTLLLVAAASIGWLAWVRRIRLPSPPPAFVGVFLAWACLATASLAWTLRPDYTLSELRVEIVYVALTFAVFFFAADDPRKLKRWCLAIFAGLALALIARVLHEGLGLRLWRHPPDGGAGPYSTHLVLAAAVVPVLVLAPPWGLRRGALAFVGAWLVIFAGAWFTGNRIVWPALLAVLVVTLVTGRRIPGLELASWRALGGAVAVAGLLVATAFAASVAERSDQFFRHEDSFTASVEKDLRPRLWTIAVESWREAPWLGHGFGREILESRFLPETPATGNHPRIQHAHNTFVNVALGLGAVGLAIFVTLLVLLAAQHARMLAAPSTAMLGVMGLAMLSGFVVKNLTDDFFWRHNALVFWALNGGLLGFAARAKER